MKKLIFLFSLLAVAAALSLQSCSENYSNGKRVGFITKFSQKGLVYKSWEGELNMTQTGMNTSNAFEFSIDNDNEPAGLVARLDSALQYGYKVEVTYHEVSGYNWFNNRGHTDHFVTECLLLDAPKTVPVDSIYLQDKSEFKDKPETTTHEGQ